MIKLYDHQQKTLEQLKGKDHVGIFHDMGLGKTYTGSEKMAELGANVNLVICQKSKVDDWLEHFGTNYPKYRVLDLTNNTSLTAFMTGWEKRNNGMKADPLIGVINYDLVWRRKQLLELTGYTLMLDESQNIQNEKAKRSKFILKMAPENVILLSGTPTSGKYEALWSQCRMLGWNIARDVYWNTYIDVEWYEDPAGGFKRPMVVGYKNVDRLKRKLAEYGAVFLKTEECFDLPEQREITVKVKAPKEYQKFMKESYVVLPDGTELVGDAILSKFLRARQLCGQYCMEKLEAFRDILASTRERVVVFYNFYAELDLLKEIAIQLEKPVSIVNGEKKDTENYEKCEDAVLFGQYAAAGTGLNLQAGHITIYYTLPFGKGSCGIWEQSKKRTHRIGQSQSCLYYYLLCEKTIETENLTMLNLGKEYNDELFKKKYYSANH